MEKLASPQRDKPINGSDTLPFALNAVQWLEDKKGINIRLYAVSEVCSYADYILVCSGTSDRHLLALAEELRVRGKKTGRKILGTEGTSQGQWILIDYGDVVFHLFHSPVREYYELDRLWKDQRISTSDGSKYVPLSLTSSESTSDKKNDDEYDDNESHSES